MKLEEILPYIREGRKVRLKDFDNEGRYRIAGSQSLPDCYDDDGKLCISKKTLTIHLCDKDGNFIINQYSWGIPRWSILCDYWELVE